MRSTTADQTPKVCAGPCNRQMAATNQPMLDPLLNGDDLDAPAPHYKHTHVCVECVHAGWTPETVVVRPVKVAPATPDAEKADEVKLPTHCEACERALIDDETTKVEPDRKRRRGPAEPLELLALIPDPSKKGPLRHPDHVHVCWDCINKGYQPSALVKRRDVVIENCEFYLAHNIGLTEAADREGYGDRSHLDSVLRRWGRLDLTHALGALDPAQVRERL